jgi:prolyl-tRNA synthetase
MIDGDDKGAVFPPRVAEFQFVLIPVGIRANGPDNQKLLDDINQIAKTPTNSGIRVQCDTRMYHSSGWKFAEHELRGVPLRLDFSPKTLLKEWSRPPVVMQGTGYYSS